jgi:hypothetical protein
LSEFQEPEEQDSIECHLQHYCQSRKDNGKDRASLFSSLLGLIPLVTILTAAYYFIYYQYYSSFFNQLSLPSRDLNIVPTFFMTETLVSFLMGLSLIFLWLPIYSELYGPSNESSPKIKVENIFFLIITSLSIIFFIPVILLGWPSYLNKIFNIGYLLRDSNFEGVFRLIIFLLILACMYISYQEIYKNRDLSDEIRSLAKPNESKNKLIFITIYFILYILLISNMMGAYHAIQLRDGTLWNNYAITIEMTGTSANLQNSSLIHLPLVMHYDSKYYIINNNKSYPENVKMIIIPDSVVKSASIEHVPYFEDH